MQTVIEGAGVPLAVQDRGPGESVVLVVHGMAADALTWAGAADALTVRGLRVVTYDRRGYGASGAPEPYTGTTVAEQAADALAVLDALAVDEAVVAGEGFGALVALDLALRFPVRVRALVCLDPPLFLLVPDAAQALAEERVRLEDALRAGGRSAAVAVWLDRRGADADTEAVARAQAAAQGFFADYAGLASLSVTRRRLRAVAVPAAVVTSPSCSAEISAAADALAALLPDAWRDADGDLVGGVLAVAA